MRQVLQLMQTLIVIQIMQRLALEVYGPEVSAGDLETETLKSINNNLLKPFLILSFIPHYYF